MSTLGGTLTQRPNVVSSKTDVPPHLCFILLQQPPEQARQHRLRLWDGMEAGVRPVGWAALRAAAPERCYAAAYCPLGDACRLQWWQSLAIRGSPFAQRRAWGPGQC